MANYYSSNKYRIVFYPSGKVGLIEEGENILEAAHKLGVSIRSECGGKGKCGKCKIIITDGRDNLSPLTEQEIKTLRKNIKYNYRLACCSFAKGPVKIFIPEETKDIKPSILTFGKHVPFKIEPLITNYYLEINPPSLSDSLGDWERLKKTLETTYNLKRLKMDYFILPKLSKTLRDANWKITATVWDDIEVINVKPGHVDKLFGMAIDIGTTTVVGYLVNLQSGKIESLDSMTNPQIEYGEDIMTRIFCAITEKNKRKDMQTKIIHGLNNIIKNTSNKAKIKPDQIDEIVVVGNTAMHHFFLGLDTEYLSQVPFPPVVNHSLDIKAREIGLRANPCANVHILPIKGGFVGADNVGVLIATEPYNQDEMILTIDIGTNGEIVLGNKECLLCSSTAAGPVFEGAHIKFGMRAATGAIDHISINPVSYEVTYKTIGDKKPIGICGSGIIDAVAELFRCSILFKEGRLSNDYSLTPNLRMGDNGPEFVLAWKDETTIGRDIVITQIDIREVQLAKAAILAGSKVLMSRLGLKKIDKIVLAGAFGSYINPESARLIGLFPDCELDKIVAVGNAAAYGAQMALLSKKKREEAQWVSKFVKYIELAADKNFERLLLESTHFPHKNLEEFPSLKPLLPKAQKVGKLNNEIT